MKGKAHVRCCQYPPNQREIIAQISTLATKLYSVYISQHPHQHNTGYSRGGIKFSEHPPLIAAS